MGQTIEFPARLTKLSTAVLKRRAIAVFNAWIRKRDEGNPCISSGIYTVLQAGHYYSAGKYSHLRFDEDNCHGQSIGDNYYKSGNLLEYRKNLLKKIGPERLAELDRKASIKTFCPDSRFYFMEIIMKYAKN